MASPKPPQPPSGIKRTPDHSKRFVDIFNNEDCYDFPLCDGEGETIEYTINKTQELLLDGTYNFVIRGNEEDTLYLIKLDDAMRTNLQRCSTKEPLPMEFPHACLAGRKQGTDPLDYLVISAGEITVSGNVYTINNKSGHFRPHQDTLAYVEHLINKYFIGVEVTLSEDLLPNTNECLVNLGTEPEPAQGSKKKRKKKKHSSKKRRRSKKRRKSKRRRKIPHKRKTMRGGMLGTGTWKVCAGNSYDSEEEAFRENFNKLIKHWADAEKEYPPNWILKPTSTSRDILQVFRNSITHEDNCDKSWDDDEHDQFKSRMKESCTDLESVRGRPPRRGVPAARRRCPPTLRKSINTDRMNDTFPPNQTKGPKTWEELEE